MLDLVIRGGQVVSPAGVGMWDVGIEGERIVVLAAAGTLTADNTRVLDATGNRQRPFVYGSIPGAAEFFFRLQ